MKRFFFLLAAIGYTAFAWAAGISRTWGEGPLSIRDFSLPADTAAPTSFAGELVQTVISDPEGGMKMMIRAVSDPAASFASPQKLSPQRLAYHQAQFDRLEILARNLQKDLSSGVSAKEAESRLRIYNDYYRDELRKMAEETDNGNDPEAVGILAINVKEELDNSPEPSMLDVKPSPFSYGLFVATGPFWTTGSLHSALSWAWDFTFGLRVQWMRLRLDAQISYASPTIRNPQLLTDKIDLGDPPQSFYATVNNANFLGLAFDIGFSVFDSPSFSVTPFLGGMFGQYSWGVKPITYDDKGAMVLFGEQQAIAISNFNLWFGVNCEWHFSHSVSSSSMLGAIRQELVSSIGLTPFAAKGAFNKAIPAVNGWQVGFTVSYSGMVRALTVR